MYPQLIEVISKLDETSPFRIIKHAGYSFFLTSINILKNNLERFRHIHVFANMELLQKYLSI